MVVLFLFKLGVDDFLNGQEIMTLGSLFFLHPTSFILFYRVIPDQSSSSDFIGRKKVRFNAIATDLYRLFFCRLNESELCVFF